MDDKEDLLKIKKALNDYTQDEFICDEFINYDEECDEDDLVVDSDPESAIIDLHESELTTVSTYDTLPKLKPNEKSVIDSCTDPELKNLLILNRQKHAHLLEFYNKIRNIVYVTQSNLKTKYTLIKDRIEEKKQLQHCPLTKLGAPYFKDKHLYPAPVNSDVIKKRKNNEITIYDLSVSTKWKDTECIKLKGAVKTSYSINMQKDLLNKINTLQLSETSSVDEINELREKLEYLRSNENIIPPKDSDEFIDWNRISEVFLNSKHSALECRSFWHIYLRPSINKSPWSEDEIQRLTNIVKKNNYQNWENIAQELNTDRSAFTAAYHYYSNLHKKYKRGEFTKQEDTLLRNIVSRYKSGNYIPWNKVADRFKDRSRHQLFYRYTYYLKSSNLNRSRFTEAEDILLLILVEKFGRNFTKCSEYFPQRSQMQLKARYNTNLVKALKKGSFTREEDRIIWEYVMENERNSNKWSELAKKLDRCRGQIRQRYSIIKHYLNGGEDRKLEDVPSRRHLNTTENENCFGFLRHMADQFKDRNIPTLPAIEKLLLERKNNVVDTVTESEGDEDLQSIDDLLAEFFFNSVKLGPSGNSFNAIDLNTVTDTVQTIVNLLQVSFVLPKDYQNNPNLDDLDKSILTNLVKYRMVHGQPLLVSYKSENNVNSNELVPPNLNTLIGLRGLLINHRLYKENTKHFLTEISWTVEKCIKEMSSKRKVQFKIKSDIFFKRFFTLFKWPSILTLQKPGNSLLNALENGSKTSRPKMKTYGSRKRALMPDVANKNREGIKRPKITELECLPSTSDSNQACGNDDLRELRDLEKLNKVLKYKMEASDTDSDDGELITGL